MKVIEPPLANICETTISFIGSKDAEPDIRQFFYRMQMQYVKGWKKCPLCDGTGFNTVTYPGRLGHVETMDHMCVRCNGLGFYDEAKMVEDYRKRIAQTE